MLSSTTVFLKTIEKFDDAIERLGGCILAGDFAAARQIAITFTRYESCYYCINYRQTLAPVQTAGVCGVCPLQLHGEGIAGRTLRQNACYRVPCYRQMVRAATWLLDEPSRESAQDLVEKIKATKEYLQGIENEVCANVT